MAEQSHKREMSDALRGDFDRLRKRGVVPSLTPTSPSPADELARPAEPEPEPEAPPEASPPTRRSALSRLFGRD
jgi:hypothetical protein